MMNIPLSEVIQRKGEPYPFQLTLEPLELKNRHQEIRALSPVETRGDVTLVSGLFHVKGRMQADVDFVCARCLTPFCRHVTIPFTEVFVPADSGLEVDEDSDMHRMEGDELALLPYLEEDFLLAMPDFPLCDEDCRGLCPTCGVNRNVQACGCKNERIDPRLAGLADFFKQTD